MNKKIIILNFLTISTFINAQTNEKEETDTIQNQIQLNESIITSTRFKELKNQSAAIVTVITQKEIKEFALINPDVSQILGLAVPGFGLPSNTTSNRSQSLRGRAPLILINGIPQSTPLRSTDREIRTIDPSAIERIEVIKGSTSIYGNGAIGGVINIITKKNSSSNPFGGETNFQTSSHNYLKNDQSDGYRINQQFYGKVNKFNYYLSGTINKTGTAIDGDNTFISPRYGLGDTKTINLNLNLNYSITNSTSLELMYNFYNSLQNTNLTSTGGKYLQSPEIGILGKRNENAVDEGTKYNHNAYFKVNSKEIFKNTDLEASFYTQNFYTIYDYRNHNPKKPRWEGTSGQATIKASKYGSRLQLNSKINGNKIKTELLYGADYLNDNTAQPLVDGRYWVPELVSNNIAPFLQTKTSILDLFILKLGVRYDYIDVKVPNYQVLGKTENTPRLDVKGGHLKYNNTSFNGSLVLDKFKVIKPYVSYSEGFSLFDLGRTLRDAKSDVLSKIETDPVKTSNYEIGAYINPIKNLNLSGAYFYSYSKLGSDLVAENGFWIVDRSPQKVYGFEITADYKVSPKINIGGNYSNFEGKKKTKGSTKWNEYSSGLTIPADKLFSYIKYKPIDNLFLNLQYIHTGKRDRFNTNDKGIYNEGEGIVKPLDLFNFTAQYSYKKAIFGIGIENVLNKTYYTNLSQISARDKEYARGNGRYVNLSLGYKF